jgi:hypothetical protein
LDKQLTEVLRGEEAAKVLESPAYKEAIEKVRAGIIANMASSPLGDEKTHNKLVIALQTLNQIEKQLQEVMTTGKLAAMQQETVLQKAAKFIRR